MKQIEIKSIKKEMILFNENIIDCDYYIKTPILVDKNYECILGNSLKNKLNDDVDVIIFNPQNTFERNCFLEFENDLIRNINQEKISIIEKQINDYILKYNNKIQQISIFGNDDFYENRCITEEIFDSPPEFKFKSKMNSKKKNEVEEYENLFSLYGDE